MKPQTQSNMTYTIETKELDNGDIIYTAKAPMGIKLRYPIGYFKTEQEAIDAFESASQ